MKKLLALLLAMILCLGALASCNSEKANDSVDLPKKESSLARTTMFDSVIKISSYESLPKTIADDLNVRAIFYDYYIVHPFSINLLTKDKYYDYNGNFVNGEIKKATKSEFFDYALYPEKIFGYFTKINNVYCTYSGYGMDILCIYYETSKGDYVLATHAPCVGEYDPNEEIYLFTAEEYREISDMHTDKILSLTMPVFGGIGLDDVADISENEIEPRLISWEAILGMVVTFGAVCVIGALIIVKKRKSNIIK